MLNQFSRTELLIGEKGIEKLKNALAFDFPKKINEAIVNKSPISLCVFPLSNTPFSNSSGVHNDIFDK